MAVILTSNLRLIEAPGNVLLPAANTGLPRASVANVTQVVTLDEDYLSERAGRISSELMNRVEEGFARVLAPFGTTAVRDDPR